VCRSALPLPAVISRTGPPLRARGRRAERTAGKEAIAEPMMKFRDLAQRYALSSSRATRPTWRARNRRWT
jgi:hypothetical protein